MLHTTHHLPTYTPAIAALMADLANELRYWANTNHTQQADILASFMGLYPECIPFMPVLMVRD